MTDLILHIGRHKTGTTAIQRFLASNRDWLALHGYMFPETGVRGYGHHQIAESLPNRKIRMINANKARNILTDLHSEIKANPGLTLILSSEAFQQCQPWIVRRYFSLKETKIIVYLRSHLSYLPSAYTQNVHATNYSGTLQEFYRDFYAQINYLEFIRRWESKFSGLVKLRIYDKQQLFQGNIVLDFIENALGITEDISEIQFPAGDANPSLNEKVVQFKRHINETGEIHRYAGRNLYRTLPKLNQHFPAPKLTVTSQLASDLLKSNGGRDKILAKTYFDKEALFDYDKEPIREERPIGNDEIATMREKLDNLLSPG